MLLTRPLKSLLIAAILSLASAGLASAASFHSLIDQGYRPGGLSQNKAGLWGWVLTRGNIKVFCRMNVSLVYIGKDKMGTFTSAGRMFVIDKNTYLKSLNITSDDSIPHLENLKAGRPRPEDVGYCSPVR